MGVYRWRGRGPGGVLALQEVQHMPTECMELSFSLARICKVLRNNWGQYVTRISTSRLWAVAVAYRCHHRHL
jgi:hypothetical protein